MCVRAHVRVCLPVCVCTCVCLHAQSNRTKPPHRKCKTGRGKKEGRAKRETTEAKGKTEVREQEGNNIDILRWEVRARGGGSSGPVCGEWALLVWAARGLSVSSGGICVSGQGPLAQEEQRCDARSDCGGRWLGRGQVGGRGRGHIPLRAVEAR